MKKLLENLSALIPFLDPYPLWVKLVISSWVLLTALVLLALVFARQQLPPGTAQISPLAESAAASVPPALSSSTRSTSQQVERIISADSVEQIRAITSVRPLRPMENDLGISRLPVGVFGFTVPWTLGRGIDGLSLHQNRGGTVVMEIHKAADGVVYVVCYVAEADLVRMQDPSRLNDSDLPVFFEPYREFAHVVAVPVSRIVKSNERSVDDHYLNDVTVR